MEIRSDGEWVKAAKRSGKMSSGRVSSSLQKSRRAASRTRRRTGERRSVTKACLSGVQCEEAWGVDRECTDWEGNVDRRGS